MALQTCQIKNTGITWIDIFDPTEQEIESVSSTYKLNSYTLLDSLDPDHLPKFEEYNDTHFLIIRLLHDEMHQQPSIQSPRIFDSAGTQVKKSFSRCKPAVEQTR